MSRFLSVLIICLITIAFCSCSNNNTTVRSAESGTEESTSDEIAAVSETKPQAERNDTTDYLEKDYIKGIEYLNSLIDTELFEKQYQLENNEQQESVRYASWYNDDVEAVDIPMDIQIGGRVITVGETRVVDLEKLGYIVETPTDSLAVGESRGVTIKLPEDEYDGKIESFAMPVTEENTSDSPLDINSARIFEVNMQNNPLNLPFVYRGIEKSTSPDDMISILGTPNQSAALYVNTNSEYPVCIFLYYRNVYATLEIRVEYDPESDNARLQMLTLKAL